MRQIVLDTETTGLSTEAGHRVIEIGCVELVNRRLTGNHFHRYINPDRLIEQGAQEVHGLSNDFLKDKPKFHEVVTDFFNFVQNAELIAHNAPFDIGFINYEFQLCNFSAQDITEHCTVCDTLSLARRLHPGQKNTLDALCKRYNINHFNREWHGALLDAEILAQVYLVMTGGQSTLFAETVSQESPLKKSARTKAKSSCCAKIPVVFATAEELAAHENFLALLRKKRG